MASKNELIEIRMKLLGAKEVAEGTGIASKGIKGVGTSARRTAEETSKASKATNVLSKGYGKLGQAAKFGLGFLGVGGVFALEQAVMNTEELSKTTTGLNRNLRLSTQDSSRWAAVAHARGIASTALNMSFTKLSKTFVEANRKGGTARTSLNQLGITQNETAKGAKDFSYALELVSKKFGEAKGGPERQAAAMSLLGKGYSTVLPLFAQGNKGLKEQLGWADKYGVTLNGKTNKALMDMVNAQRESKVAMLGLQVSLTKALMPAIEGGESQLQEFIATLNDPKMSGAEKITKIEGQFEDLEETLIHGIAQALPKIAENGGQLGIKLGEAVWTGFKNSNLVGKLVIGAWLFKFMGGFSLIGTLGAKVGGKLAASLGTKFLETVAPYFAAEAGVEGIGAALGSQMAGLRTLFAADGAILGTAMGAAAAAGLIAEVVFAVKDAKNIAGLSLFDTPQTANEGFEKEDTYLTGLGYDIIKSWPGNIIARNPHSGKKDHFHYEHGEWVGPGLESDGGHHGKRHPKRQAQAKHRPNPASDRRYVQHIHLHVRGREIAEAVLQEGEDQAALA